MELDVFKTTHGFLQDSVVLESLQTRLNSTQTAKAIDISNVEFEPTSAEERRLFGDDYINADLQALGLSRLGTLEVRRERLITALGLLAKMRDMEQTVNGIDFSGALILIEQAVPCVFCTAKTVRGRSF